ncbi:nineteen complex-related protein 2-domain-containing protein [Rhodocollybia butyracea]|uniref:Nineteen complex-related protein 2-domain-containing protein n=1 Tax=Rhodocollybia butyracea TaxID=206335 RepID=A0A9P5UFP8_9AGAR|nr:nineteen complex-related protein 2-domain-containing protein [Rhodocollybia butyracea]
MFKRPKSKPTPRTRGLSPEPQIDANNESEATSTIETASEAQTELGSESPLSAVKKFKDRTKKSRPKSRLSFGAEDDEDSAGEVFKLKKSKLSRNLSLGKHPSSIPDNLDQASISPSRNGPTYNEAYLKELKKNTPTSRAPPPPPDTSDPYDADMSMDISMDLEDVSVVDITDADTLIHTESTIKQAKERRERVRKTGVSSSEDYISLSVTRRVEDQGPHPESRLVREEDELGEGDDEFAEYTSAQERIALGKKSRKAEASKRREMMQELITEATNEDEESTEWEFEQLRRGGHLTSDSPSSKPVKQTYVPAPSKWICVLLPPTTPIPTLGPALARLTQQLAQLTTSHASNTTSLNTLAQERDQVDAREKELRALVEKAEEKRAWFSTFSDWVESVAAFLDEKYPLLENLEDEQLSILRERHDIINKRRLQDMEDDLTTFLGPLPNAPDDTPSEPTFDEFGREIRREDPIVARRRRQDHRSTRYQVYRDVQPRQGKIDDEGYWTDSDLPLPDQAAYQDALGSIATRTGDVLVDVKSKEFLDLAKSRWGTWRKQYEESYVAAFGGLGVVSAWEFWARLESVGWDCIQDPKSLDSFRWYHGLYEFCHIGDPNDGEVRELGPEGDLVGSMVSTAIIPRLSKIIEAGALDVYSGSHIRRVADLAEELEASVSEVDEGALRLQVFHKAVITSFARAITANETLLAKHTSATGTGSSAFNPESIPARIRFLARQVKLVMNLVRWRKCTGELFGVGQLITRLVDGCMVDVADGGWDVGGEELLRKVAAMLPKDLVVPGVASRLG